MYIPEFILWLMYILVVINVVKHFSNGQFDFVTPVIGLAAIFIPAAFRVGFLLGEWL